MDDDNRHMTPLTTREALDRLAAAPFGRVIFTQHAMPALRHVNHVISNGQIIIRSHHDAAITARAGNETVVLYQAEDINPATRAGWTVAVTGLARLITDPGRAAAHRDTPRPWTAGTTTNLIAITPDIITGFRLAPAHRRHDGHPCPTAR